MSIRDVDKATRYVDQLDVARLDGAWVLIDELSRKVMKHAPTRTDLSIAATVEAELAKHSVPSHSQQHSDVLTKIIEKITRAQGDSRTRGQEWASEDSYSLIVSLAHAQYLLGNWQDVVSTLSSKSLAPFEPLKPTLIKRLNSLKVAYLLGSAYQKLGLEKEATRTYQSALSDNSIAQDRSQTHAELQKWTSMILSQSCSRSSDPVESQTLQTMNEALLKFRNFANATSGTARTSSSDDARQTWSDYHGLLSEILFSNLVYGTSDQSPLQTRDTSTARTFLSAQRCKQFQELRGVERSIEQHVLAGTSFPKASEDSRECELLIDTIVTNWRYVFNVWTESDIGSTGKHEYTRNVLETVYRAASKTFHSTTILRQLFTLHAALGEFNLAVKAFDSYTEIITKGKARSEKTGKHESGLDSDDTVLYTAAEVIKLLCTFGERNEAEKAYEIAERVTTWLQQIRPRSSGVDAGDPVADSSTERVSSESLSSPAALAIAYRAIGQSEATWAHYTYDPAQRESLQDESIVHLKRSIMYSSAQGVDTEATYLLACSQAERRLIDAATHTLKNTILTKSSSLRLTGPLTDLEAEFERQRSLLPHTHLLVLLLGARNDYETALKLCETTVDNLIDAAGACDREDALPTTETGEASSISTGLPARLLEHLRETEMENFIQLKMTEIELRILLENAAYAHSSRQDLLYTHRQFFGEPLNQPTTNGVNNKNMQNSLPKSRSGTIKSFRQSVFGRSRHNRKSLDKSTFKDSPPPLPDHPLLKENAAGVTTAPQPLPPSLTVTNEDGEHVRDEHKGRISRISLSIRRGKQRHSHHPDNLARQNPTDEKGVLDDTPPVPAFPKDASATNNNVGQRTHQDAQNEQNALSDDGRGNSPNSTGGSPVVIEPLRKFSSIGHFPQAPFPALSRLQRRTHHLSCLVDIWLFISNLYIKEDLYEEAWSAVEEATSLITELQTEMGKSKSSADTFNNRGWGLGKSVSHLMADVFTQRGSIFRLTSSPHQAIDAYEHSLLYFPDHPPALIGISSILLDMYERKIPAEQSDQRSAVADISGTPDTFQMNNVPPGSPFAQNAAPSVSKSNFTPVHPALSSGDVPPSSTTASAPSPLPNTGEQSGKSVPSPADMNLLACRDRAYMLVRTLTKLGTGWDRAEAWFELSRAYELMDQSDKAAECLWFVVGLEDTKPVRRWDVVGALV